MMKTVAKYICLLAMMLVAVPVMGQDYAIFHLKNNLKKSVDLRDMISMYQSKTDGNVSYSYSAFQVISFPDSIVYIPLEEIDSVSFLMKEEIGSFPTNEEEYEKSKKITENIGNGIAAIVDEENGNIDASTLASQILGLDGVSKAEVSSDATSISIIQNDGVKIIVAMDTKTNDNALSHDIETIKRLKADIRAYKEKAYDSNSSKNVSKCGKALMLCPFSWDFSNLNFVMAEIEDLLNENFETVDVWVDEEACVEKFYGNNLEQYDFIYIFSHGGTWGFGNLSTSTIYTSTHVLTWESVKSRFESNEYVIGSTIRHPEDYYVCMTPSFLDGTSFNNTHVFVSACNSAYYMRGEDSMLSAFINHGAATYIGYNTAVMSTLTAVAARTIIGLFTSGVAMEDAVDYWQNSSYTSTFINTWRDAYYNGYFEDLDVEDLNSQNIVLRTNPVHKAALHYASDPFPVLKSIVRNDNQIDFVWDCQMSSFTDDSVIVNDEGKSESTPISYVPYYDLYINGIRVAENIKESKSYTWQPTIFGDVSCRVVAKMVDENKNKVLFTYEGESKEFHVESNLITSLTITSPTTTMDLCEMRSIEYHFTPIDADNKTMEWTSSDPSVVMVDQNGIATALKTGTCTLTVKTTDGSNLSATCTITVTGNGGPKTDQPEVNETSVTFYGHHTCNGDFLRGFAYWEEGHEDQKTFVNSLSTGIAFSATVSGLKEGTTYCCQAVCTHYEHNFYANVVKFTTTGTSTPATGEHEYVDLGLSVMWATCNVGASTPEDYGDYYAWGETETKEVYNWSTYLDSPNRDGKSFTKYNNYGGMTKLDPEDDVAHVKWKGNWRMPTRAELEELKYKCTRTWDDRKEGYKVTGPNGNSIFLPAAGYRDGSNLGSAGSGGHYWSSSLDASDSDYAYSMYFYSGYVYSNSSYRGFGLSVRPVYDAGGSEPFLTLSVYDYSVGASGGEVPIKYESNVSCTCRAKEDWITFSSSNPTVMIVAPNPTSAPRTNKVVIENEEYGLKETITVVQDAGEAPSGEHEYVDLGLSVKWATCNVGASTPEDYGDYYAWGETETKEVYDWSTYLDSPNRDGKSFTKYNSYVGMTIQLDPEDDVAHVKWKGNWRMPTRAELEELRTKCTWTWNDSKKGYDVTGPSGNSIFLPAAGERGASSLYYAGDYGEYWSSSLGTSYAYHLDFSSGHVSGRRSDRYYGLSVRPVCP